VAVPAVAPESFQTFGDLLKYLRRRERLTQLELSITVGYSEGQISRLEQNQRLPDLTALKALFIPALHLEGEPEVTARLIELADSAHQEDAPMPGLPPYRGLLYFDESESHLFFGREALTASLATRVADLATDSSSRFLAVVGASGSGKSSLVRAGLAVAVRNAGWGVRVFTPTLAPSRSLQTQLNSNRARQKSERALLIVDQFEETFTLCHDEADRINFIDRLLQIANEPDGKMSVTIALRADFYSHCAQYPALRNAVAAEQAYIGQMTSAELRRAIEEPARRGGWGFEPGLVELILQDIGVDGAGAPEPGALPLLSHALLATWERRRGNRLNLDGYRAAGGVRSAIAETAESVFTDHLNEEQQDLVHDIFLRLTELGEGTEDTRRRAALNELVRQSAEAVQLRTVLNILAEARLITLNEDSAEVAHEALIREWHRLRDWLTQDRDGLRLHRHLTESAGEWESRGRDRAELYRGARLAQAREWAQSNLGRLNPSERIFLQASVEQEERDALEREEQRRRALETAQKLAETERQRAEEGASSASQLRKRALYLAGAFVVAFLMALAALFFGERARQAALAAQANLMRSTAQRLAAEAQTLLEAGGDAELIALLSVLSMQTEYTAQGDTALLEGAALDYPRTVLGGDEEQVYVYSVAYSPDGKYALTGAVDGTAILWDWQTGQIVRRFAGHWGRVADVAFSPDGTFILTGSDDGTARLWDAETGKELRRFTNGEGSVLSVAFSPDGRSVLAAGEDGIARLWDLHQNDQEPREFIGHMDRVFSAVFAPNGRQILTDSQDGTVRLWDAATGREERRFAGANGYGGNAVFSPDGRSILIASGFGSVPRLLDAETGEEIRRFVGHQSGVGRVAFSPDGQYVLTGSDDKTARLWDAGTGEELRRFTAHGWVVRSLAFSPDGNHVLTGSWDSKARIWDLRPDPELPQFRGHADGVTAVGFSDDGKKVLTGSADKTARLWDAHTGRELRAFIGHTDGLNYGVAFSPDDRYVVTGSWDGTARLWDARTGSELRRFAGHTAGVNRVVFSPDGKTLLSASNDTTARLWDVQDGTELCQFVGHTGPVSWGAFSPDGKSALTGSDDRTARLWDIASCEEIRTIGPHPDSVYGAAFSPDGRYVATGDIDGIARLWDTQTGDEVRDFVGHLGPIWSVGFSPDGKLVGTVSDDKTARLWDVQSGHEVRRFAYSAGLADVAFSPDGEYLLTGSYDGTARLWEIDYRKTIEFLCGRLSRDLTNDERAQYEIGDSEPTCAMP
jgi:WD40 repeat protein/transcriptional regulator with XRE-family HTH domain/energy-coupling factor transporter ATP-binding protein EcfA2